LTARVIAAMSPPASRIEVPAGGPPAEQDHRDWMAEEMPFQASQRPWERADLIVCGTPQIPCDPATELVIAPPVAAPDNSRAACGE
jgi:hypothetical protein